MPNGESLYQGNMNTITTVELTITENTTTETIVISSIVPVVMRLLTGTTSAENDTLPLGCLLTQNSNTTSYKGFTSLSSYVLTTAPTAAWTGGGYKIVVLTTDPATKYDGYIYYIVGSST